MSSVSSFLLLWGAGTSQTPKLLCPSVERPTEGSCWRPLKALWHGKEGVGLLGFFAEGGGAVASLPGTPGEHF